MNAAETSRRVVRPIPDILDEAWRLYHDKAAEYYVVAAVGLLVSWTLNQIIKVWTIGGMPLGVLEDPRAPEFFRRIGQVFAAGFANGMTYALVNSMAGAVITLMVAAREQRRPVTLGDGMRQAAPRLAPLLGATLLYFLAMAALVGLGGIAASVTAAGGLITGLAGGPGAVVLGLLAGLAALAVLLAFAIAVLYLSLRWGLYAQVAVLERAGAIDALRESMRLSRDAPGTRLFDRYLFRAAVLTCALVLLQIVAGTIGGVPEYGVGLLFGTAGDPASVSILNPTGMPLALLIPLEIFSVLLSAAVFPYGIAVFVLLYQDVRRLSSPPDAAG